MNAIVTEEAYQIKRKEREKKGLKPEDITMPRITGIAAKNHVQETRRREEFNAKGRGGSFSKVIRER